VTGSRVAGVIALSRAERRLIEGLRRAGAVHAGAARPLEGRGLEAERLERLLETGVVLEAAPGVYYVDETEYARYRQSKWIGVLAIAAILLLVAVILAIRTAL
jgi:hypothetical protein